MYWQHQVTGAVAIWYMSGPTLTKAEALSGSVSDPQWKVRAVADLDRDGFPDLIWQHAGTGHLAVWFTAYAQVRRAHALSPGQVPDVNWRIAGAGDVNGDGHPDLFWHHASSGQVAVWMMQGGSLLRAETLATGGVADTNWQLRGVGYVDGNQTPDLIWQNTTTLQVAVWLMNGLSMREGRMVIGAALASADWHISH